MAEMSEMAAMAEMHEIIALVCILCPKGCEMTVSKGDNQPLVLGNSCKKGEGFAIQEWLEPKRMLCTTVKTNSERYPRLPVKTSGPIPKPKVLDLMVVLDDVVAELPILMGACLVKNIGGLGVDLVATATMQDDEDNHSHGQ